MGDAVAASHIQALAPFLAKLDELTADLPGDIWVDAKVTFFHRDGWVVADAEFMDDVWWANFARYGQDEPPTVGRPTGGSDAEG